MQPNQQYNIFSGAHRQPTRAELLQQNLQLQANQRNHNHIRVNNALLQLEGSRISNGQLTIAQSVTAVQAMANQMGLGASSVHQHHLHAGGQSAAIMQ
jgi:hypothetical protein